MPKSIILLLLCLLPLIGMSQSARKTNKLLQQEYASKLRTHDSLARLYDSSKQELLQFGEIGSEAVSSYSLALREIAIVKETTISLFKKTALLELEKSVGFTLQSIEQLYIPDARTLLEELSKRYEDLDIIQEQSFYLDLNGLKVSEQNRLLSAKIDEMNGKIAEYSLFHQRLPGFMVLFKEDCSRLKSEEEKWRIEIAALELKQRELEEVLQVAKANYAKNGPEGFDEQYSVVFPKETETKTSRFSLDFGDTDGFEEAPIPLPAPPISDDVVHSYVEELPEFPGGMTALKAFIDANLKIPEVALDQRIEGKCYLQFVVSAQGNISNVKVVRGVPDCDECDKEAIRMVKAMPKWKPGKIEGKPVNSTFNLPVSFKLP
jgi:TonB family protein